MTWLLVSSILLNLILGLLVAYLVTRRRRAVREAVKQSRRSILGQVVEQVVPLMGFFPFNPRDARFLGSPIDFVVFDGLSHGEVRRIVFVEVKTGRGRLNGVERRVRRAVEEGRVEFMTVKVPT